MSYMLFVSIGLSMIMLGWIGFRRPGVSFWTFAPVWKANKYLRPTGAALWIVGCLVGLTAMGWQFLRPALSGTGLVCSNPAGVKLVQELIVEQAEKGLRGERRPDGSQLFEGSRIRAAIPLFASTLVDFRTTKEGSNRDKAVCEARIKYVVPTEILSRTEEGLTMLSIPSFSALADSSGFEQEANAFIKDISYTLQYTDDRKSIYASLQAGDPFVGLLTALTSAYLVQPLVVENKNRALSAAEALRLSEEQAAADAAKLAAEAAQAVDESDDGRAPVSRIGAADDTSSPRDRGTDATEKFASRNSTPDRQAFVANRTPPQYPLEEQKRGIEGTSVLIVSVDESGAVLDVEVERSSGNRNLDRAAVAVARTWTFAPEIKDGEVVASRVRVPVDFHLR